MARGVLAGVICGAAVAGVGAVALSLLTGPPLEPAPDVVVGAAPDGPPLPEGGDTAPKRLSEEAEAVTPEAAERPEAPGSASPEAAPAEPASSGPEIDAAPSISEEPQVPASPAADEPAPAAPLVDDGAGGADAPEATETPETEEMPAVGTVSAPAPEPAEAPEAAEAPEVETAPQAPSAEAAPAAGTDAPEQPGAPEEGDAPVTDESASALSSDEDMRSGEAHPETDLASDENAASAGLAPDPVRENAAAVDVAEGAPLMAVVLIDDGSGPLGPDALGAFPFPVSFAISPDHPDPEAAARAYRALGHEVLTMAGVPEGAEPEEVAARLQTSLDRVPEAVGVLEDPDLGLQARRAISDEVTVALGETGHGLLMLPKGLDTAQQLAARAGVPSVALFRDFDGAGQDPATMRRLLDQGASRAQEGGPVAMLGRLSADTVSALVLWGLQDRARSVRLVPVSAVLEAAE